MNSHHFAHEYLNGDGGNGFGMAKQTSSSNQYDVTYSYSQPLNLPGLHQQPRSVYSSYFQPGMTQLWPPRRSSGPEFWWGSESSSGSRKSSMASQGDVPSHSPITSSTADLYSWESAYPGRSSTNYSSYGQANNFVIRTPNDMSRPQSSFLTRKAEPGINFPGCNVLVLSTDGHGSEQSREPKLRSNQKSKKRTLTAYERAQTRRKRKTGVCLRCKKGKEKCEGELPCKGCKMLKNQAYNCVSAILTDKSCFGRDLYKSRLDPLRGNVAQWTSSSVVIEVSASNGFRPTLRLEGREYTPLDGSLLNVYHWKDSDAPASSIDAYLDSIIPYLVGEYSLKEETEDLITNLYSRTISAAYDLYRRENDKSRNLVHTALRIWAAHSIFFQRPWRICGNNTLGMQSIATKSGLMVPVPRLVGQQLDSMVESRLKKLEGEFLKKLQVRVHNYKPRKNNYNMWFGTYLAIFIFVWGLEKDISSLNTWEVVSSRLREKFEAQPMYSPTSRDNTWLWPLENPPRYFVDKNTRLAQILAEHFRSLTGGQNQFDQDWHSMGVMKLTAGEETVVEYMRTVVQWAKGLKKYFAKRSENFSRDGHQDLTATLVGKLIYG